MEKTIFLSYNHSNKNLREKLELEIPKNLKGIKIITDENAVRGKQLHKEISKLVNQSHIIVPIITKDWLKSNETRDELVRAHERRKYIICFLASEDIEDYNELPFYLRDALRIQFNSNDLDLKIRELCDAIDNFSETWKREVFDHIRVLGDYLDNYVDGEPYKIDHLSEAIKKARGEVSQIVHKNLFKRRISYEDNFLRTAIPYYKAAKTISAVSIADISTFWEDPDVHDSVDNYLQLQSSDEQTVVRLFVFKNPVKANSFKNILQANYRAYGKNGGGVFLCSYKSYKKLLPDISTDRAFLRSIDGRDFGVLTYNFDNPKRILSAILDAQELVFEKLSPEEGSYNSFESFSLYLNSLLRIPEGEFQHNCLRWSNDFYKDQVLLSEGLKNVFPDESGPILHLLMIDSSNQNHTELKNFLHSIKSKFEKNKDQLKIVNIWLRERTSVFASDGRFNGTIKLNETYDFVLGIEFNNENALNDYYRHKMHSIEREKLYCILNPELGVQFEMLNDLQGQKHTNGQRRSIYEQIELDISPFLIRLDVQQYDNIENIVNIKGIPFGSKFNR